MFPLKQSCERPCHDSPNLFPSVTQNSFGPAFLGHSCQQQLGSFDIFSCQDAPHRQHQNAITFLELSTISMHQQGHFVIAQIIQIKLGISAIMAVAEPLDSLQSKDISTDVSFSKRPDPFMG
jgi:hypothetical protein